MQQNEWLSLTLHSFFQIFFVAAFLAVAAASYAPAPAAYKPAAHKPTSYHQQPKYKEEPKPYSFDYAVNDHYSGANFAQNEKSDGHNTQGYYTVALPDGRIQTVTYVADHYNGFNADVTYKGEAQYPSYHSAPSYHAAPSYKPKTTYKPAQSYQPTSSYSTPSYHH